jgi:hypothetical protein
MTDRNKIEGEGNKSADRRFRESSRDFVSSTEGKEQIRKAGDLSEDERRRAEKAAQEGRSRAKETEREARDRD